MEALYAGGALVLLIFLGIIIKNLLSGAGSNQEAEPDPLAEAEVYLAYGRYQQAIQVLEQALEKNGLRSDIQQKLDEIRELASKTARQ
jgi:Tfp pilus assembly protein FimV